MSLESLSKEELIALINKEKQSYNEVRIAELEDENAYLKSQLAMYKRMQFGQKRERFEGDPAQIALPFEAPADQIAAQEEILKEKISYVRSRPNHKGRAALPTHLPVEEIEIYPTGDLSEMICIGKEVTEELDYEPARFLIKRYIRYKYAPKNGEGVKIGQLPERVIDKGIPSAGLLASILTDKYQDHLPLYRQKQRFAREDIHIASSTLEGWTKEALIKLEPLYQQLVFDMKSKGYWQVDESPIKVLESEKKGACHQGYYWVYHSPLDSVVLFDYQPTRGSAGAKTMLESFKGYLQTDGYAVYEKHGKRKDVTHLACWAHARREFERALDNDKTRAQKALSMIQQLYAVERKASQQMLDAAGIKELRLAESLPIGKAMQYSYGRWDALSAYLYDGNLLIDNNQIENSIRGLALGRKNYLFAGSHEAAQRAAMIYSFFAICKKHNVNPYKWLKNTLTNISTINHKNITDLYPQNFNNIQQLTKM
eukprot:gene21301-27329_t